MDTILVTGGAGFIGSHLCEKLVDIGYNVVNLDNFNDYYNSSIKYRNIDKISKNKHYKVLVGDIRKKNLLEDLFNTLTINKIVHLAALAGVRKSIQNPSEFADVDIIGTVNLLELAVKYKVKKFILASSSSVYGNNHNTPFKEEDRLTLQVSPYATSKRSAELFCETYNYLYGIPIVILRFFSVYGPRQRPEMAISLFTSLIDRGREIQIYGNGTSKRDYTYIDDIINGIVASIHLKCNYEVFNLGNSYPISLNDVVKVIENKLNKKAIRRYLPCQLGDVDITYADISKARKQLGFYPSVDFKTGIERFVDWYLKHKDIYQ